jgi:tetratricopeptide (TPR) repeat protein
MRNASHRIRSSAIVIIIFIATLCPLLAPRSADAGQRESLLQFARVLSWEKKYDESLEAYDEYISKYPKDMQARLEAGDVAFWSGDHDRALGYYEVVLGDPKLGSKAEAKRAEILAAKKDYAGAEPLYRKALEKNPDDIEARIKLAEILSYDQRYDESIAEYDIVLEKDPGNARAMRERADVLSWAERYDESLAAYDALLAINYDADAARQKARMLGWAKRYGQSIEAYREAYERTDVEAIRIEGQAKEAFWNGWPIKATKLYRQVLDIEPDNIEARFDLGQTEGYERMWDDATGDFTLILEQMPTHFRAADSLSRVSTLWKKRELRPIFNWFHARSDDRSTDINRFTGGADFRAPIIQQLALDAGYLFDFFTFRNAGSIPRHQGKIGLDFSLNPRVWGEVYYLPTGYPSDNRFSSLWNGRVSARIIDQLIVTAFTQRDDLFNQRIVFDKELHQTDVGGLIESRIHRRWTAFAGYRYRTVNDSNKQNSIGVENLIYILFEPKRLTIDVRFDWQDWKYTIADYWSPQNFWHVSGTIHWRHYLNPHGMYYGALNTYYGLKYRFQIDKEKRPFNGGAFEFHRDWNHSLETQVEAFGDYSSVYWDLGAMAWMAIRF